MRTHRHRFPIVGTGRHMPFSPAPETGGARSTHVALKKTLRRHRNVRMGCFGLSVACPAVRGFWPSSQRKENLEVFVPTEL